MDSALAELIAHELRLHWDFENAHLCVSSEWQKKEGSMQELASALLALWHFKLFSDSRWLTIGISCRTLVVALLTGLPEMIKFLKTKGVSEFHLGGWSGLDLAAKKFIVPAAIVAYVPDAALSVIFEDTRFARISGDVQEAMASELLWLETLEAQIWQQLSSVFMDEGGMAARELRSVVLAGGHTAVGYMHWKTFSPLERHPWSIACGDQDANLQALKDGDMPSQPTASKIWALLQMGLNRDKIKRALDLLLDAPWATSATEQGHSMGALVKRMHKECVSTPS